jgi:hypothetical protein
MQTKRIIAPLFKIILILALGIEISACGKIWSSITDSSRNGGGSLFSYPCASQLIHLTGIAVNDAPTVTAEPGTTYSVSPALPPGLSIIPSTGVISGTPTTVTAATNYTITATSPSGTYSATVNLRTTQGYLVNDLSDLHNTGGTSCVTASSTCTLRAAIEATVTTGASRVILVPAGTISLTAASPLNIDQGMEIYGNCQSGTTVDGLLGTAILNITAGPTTVANLTIQNGSVFDEGGAGVSIWAASGNVNTTLNNVIVKNNQITGGSIGTDDGAGIMVSGASAGSKGVLVLSNSTVSGNVNNAATGSFGGGIGFANFSQGTITNTVISDNQGISLGGGISVRSATVSIAQSLFYNNSATGGFGEGGALGLNSTSSANVTVTNCTFTGNSGDMVGAIYNGGMGSIFTILNTTIANNTSVIATYGGAIGGIGAGLGTIENTIFYNNTSAGSLSHCAGAGGFSVTSSGHNISDDGAGDCSLSGTGDIVSSSAIRLDSLRDNGGSTQTMQLLSGSAAIDVAATGSCPSVDQRGYARLAGGKCDIGAYETQ